MSILKLAWKNIIHDPLSLILNLILLSLGIGLINFIMLMNHQLKNKFEKNLAGIDLVIGAKGSPLQLILSSMYHVDAPTGNISIKEAKPFIREGHPLIAKSVPLSMGDSYRGYRIIGTDHSILELYKASISEGKLWQNLYEVTIGAKVAKELDLKLGSKFKSSHGFNDDLDMTHDHGTLTVKGILQSTGSVIDQLILVSTESVWEVHDHSLETEDTAHDHSGHDHHDHDHGEHGHDHEHHDHRNDLSRAHLLTHEDKDLTSILIQYKNKMNFQALNMPRNINENTDLQAASPAYEINRLYDMMGVGTRALQLIAALIALVSGISIFVSLLNSLKKRKYELSLMRVLGAAPSILFVLIILEALILGVLGYLIGLLFSHWGMSALGTNLEDRYNYPFQAWISHGQEWWLLGVTLALAIGAALLPALMAYKTEIHKNLSEK